MKAAAISFPHSWRALLLLQIFRSSTALLLLGFELSNRFPGALGLFNPDLFRGAVYLYLCFALAGHLLIALRRLIPFHMLIYLLYGADLLVYAAFIYSSGGVAGNLQVLLFICLFGTVVLDQGRAFLVPAAVSTLVLLFVEAATFLRSPYLAHPMQAGLYSASFFCAVLIGARLARRAARVESLALRQGRQLTRQGQLNERIVQLLRTGILVLDEQERILLFNARAAQLLGLHARDRGQPIDESFAVLRQITHPQDMSGRSGHNLVLHLRGKDLQISSMPGGRGRGSEWILLIEDLVPQRRRMQQMKLSSLGQLTASIAHEVRTPLAAIRHAAQLLRENPDARGEEESEARKLLRIIDDHCRRLNRIVENVMSLGRNRPAVVERLKLLPWVKTLVAELLRHKELAAGEVEVRGASGLWVNVDASQLHQVVWNLCENALRYSRASPRVSLRCGRLEGGAGATVEEGEGVYLEVADNGPGVEGKLVDRLFEPFFSTESSGSGLGLYVANELCQANQAVLALSENSSRGCTFRVSFPTGEESF